MKYISKYVFGISPLSDLTKNGNFGSTMSPDIKMVTRSVGQQRSFKCDVAAHGRLLTTADILIAFWVEISPDWNSHSNMSMGLTRIFGVYKKAC